MSTTTQTPIQNWSSPAPSPAWVFDPREVRALEEQLRCYRKGYERLKEELDLEMNSDRLSAEGCANIMFALEILPQIGAQRDECYAEVVKLKEELDAVEKSNRVNYDRGCEWYDHAEELTAENAKLVAEVAELKVKGEDLTLDVDEGRVLLARSHERCRKLEEQLRVKGAGVPFAEPEPAKPDQHRKYTSQ